MTQVEGTLAARVAASSVYNARLGTEELLLFFVPDAEAVPAEAVAVLHAAGTLSPQLHALVGRVRAHVTSVMSLAPRHVIPVVDERFHRTTSGKIQRGAFKKGFESGEYARATDALERGLPQDGSIHCEVNMASREKLDELTSKLDRLGGNKQTLLWVGLLRPIDGCV